MTNDKQRERLVELLEQTREKSREYFRSAIKKSLAEKKSFNSKTDVRSYIDVEADHLLANGVIVPPCKVGQTVYLIRKDTQTIYTCSVTAIIQRNTFQYLEIFIEEDKRKTIILAVLGESLFLTKEEAEEALKGGVQ